MAPGVPARRLRSAEHSSARGFVRYGRTGRQSVGHHLKHSTEIVRPWHALQVEDHSGSRPTASSSFLPCYAAAGGALHSLGNDLLMGYVPQVCFSQVSTSLVSNADASVHSLEFCCSCWCCCSQQLIHWFSRKRLKAWCNCYGWYYGVQGCQAGADKLFLVSIGAPVIVFLLFLAWKLRPVPKNDEAEYFEDSSTGTVLPSASSSRMPVILPPALLLC
jgi:hypothetical protein